MQLALLLLLASGADDGVIVVHKQGDSAGIYNTRTGENVATIPVGKKPHELVLSEDRRFAFVTNYGADTYTEMQPGDNTVSVIDLGARRKMYDIGLGDYRRPHGIERGRSGRIYVTTDFPAAVLMIDAREKKVIREFPLEETLPHMLAVTRDERTAFVACAGSGTIAVLSLETGHADSVEIGGVPMGLILSADEKRVYATNLTGDSVAVIDAERGVLLTKVNLPGQPARLQLSPDRRKLVVALMGAGEAAVIDMLTMKPERRFPAGKGVEGLAFDAKGAFLYLVPQGEDRILKVSTADWKPVLEIKTGAKPDTPALFPLK